MVDLVIEIKERKGPYCIKTDEFVTRKRIRTQIGGICIYSHMFLFETGSSGKARFFESMLIIGAKIM